MSIKVRLDPTFLERELWERDGIGADGLVLHLSALAYTNRNESDGLLSMGRVSMLTPLVGNARRVAQRLVEEGLWTLLPDGRVRVCTVQDDLRDATERGDEQPSKKHADDQRDRKLKNKRAWQDRKKEPDTASDTAPEKNRVKQREVRLGEGKGPTDPTSLHPPAGAAVAPPSGRTDTTCSHGTPDGLLATKVGTARCLTCRTAGITPVRAAS